MINRKVARVAIAGIAASAAIGLAATAFAAVPTYKITAGSKTTGTVNYTGKASPVGGKPAIHFNDVTSGINTTCVSGTATGVMKLGAHVSGTAAGNIKHTTWKTCKGPAGTTLTPVQPSTSIWTINGVARPLNGVTKVFVGNVTANVAISNGCSFTVKGSTDGTYNNTTGNLHLAPRAGSGHLLKASNTHGLCVGTVSNGDTLQFTGTYVVTTPSGKIKIT